MAPYVSRSSVASASYSSEGIVDENKNITNEKKRKIAGMRAQFRISVASWKYSLNKLPRDITCFALYPEFLTLLVLEVNISPALPGYPYIDYFRSILFAVNDIIPGICLEKCALVNEKGNRQKKTYCSNQASVLPNNIDQHSHFE
jgi:hypothetical protein